MNLSGITFKMRYRIISKLKKAGATSREKAVTLDKAELDSRERQWLGYIAGGVLNEVKKTRDQRYYV